MTILSHCKRWWARSSLAEVSAPLSPPCLSEAAISGTTEALFSLQWWDLMSLVAFAACRGLYRHALSVYYGVTLHSFSSGARSLSSMKLLEMSEPLLGAQYSLLSGSQLCFWLS